ncbi:MAG: fibronectin type III domain-containing protein [Eubacterium sp.]|nr:fibronectin type III domain-containing protein [Eubacterium sp.]
MKKALSICLSIVMLVSVISILPFSAFAFKEVTITFDSDGKGFGGGISSNPYYSSKIEGDGKIRLTANEGDTFRVRCSYRWARSADENYFATGWKLDGDDSGKVYTHGEEFTVPDGDVTFIADWHEKIAVTYDYNGGCQRNLERFEPTTVNEAESDNYIVFKADTELESTGFNGKYLYREGYNFIGWSVKGSTDGKLYQCEDTYNLKTDTTFVAQWKVDMSTHKHDFKLASTVDATCTQDGAKEYSCFCGEKKTETIPAKGHTAVIDAAVPATFKAAGKTAGAHCSVCGAVITAQTAVAKLSEAGLSKTSAKAGKNAFTATWKTVKGADGYEVQYSLKKNMKKAKKKTVKGAKKTKLKVNKLKAKKTYYVRVRAYKTVNGKKQYSKWSAVKKVKTK